VKHLVLLMILVTFTFKLYAQGMSLPPSAESNDATSKKCSVLRKVKIFCQDENIKASGYKSFPEILLASLKTNELFIINFLCWNTAQNIVDKKWSFKDKTFHEYVLSQHKKLMNGDKSDFPNNNPKWGIEKYRTDCSGKSSSVPVHPCELYLSDFENEPKALEKCYKEIETNNADVAEYRIMLRGRK
jgi:hypothetical protein